MLAYQNRPIVFDKRSVMILRMGGSVVAKSIKGGLEMRRGIW